MFLHIALPFFVFQRLAVEPRTLSVLLLSHQIILKKYVLVSHILSLALICNTLAYQHLLFKKLFKDVICEHQGAVKRPTMEKLKRHSYKGNQLSFGGFFILFYPVRF